MKNALVAIVVFALFVGPASAANKYFDVNGTGSGSGVVNATTHTWTTTNWNASSDGSGSATSFASGDTAIFSAGTDAASKSYTVNLGSGQTGSVIVDDGTVTKTGSPLTTQSITVNNGAGFFINQSLALTVAAGGTLTLNGPNATVGNSNTGANPSFLGSSSANNNMSIVLNAGGRVSANVGAANVAIYTGLIQGTGPLTVDGNGIFRLTTTAATYSGATIINGRLQISTTANVIPNGTDMTINSGGTFDVQADDTIGSLTGAGNIVMTTDALTIGGSASPAAFTGVISDGASFGSITRSGSGTLTLSGVNTYDGTFTNTSGTTTVNASGTLCGPIADVIVNGGTVNLNNAAQSIENLTGTGGTINLGAGHTLTTGAIANGTYSGTIAGAGGLTKTDAFNLTLSGNNSYAGLTQLTGTGTITVQSATALGTTAGKTTVASGAGLQFNSGSTFTINEPIDIAGTGSAVTTAGAIHVGTANTNITFGGTVTLTADAAVGATGTSGVAANFMGQAGTAFSYVGGTGKNLTLNGGSGGGTKQITGVIALGTGSLTKLQGGTWVLSGSNSYTGTTNISAGALSVANVGNAGSNSNLGQHGTIHLGATTNGGTLLYTGTGETSDKVIDLAGTTGRGTIDQSGASGLLEFTADLTATGAGAKSLNLMGSTAGTGEISGKIVDSGGGATALVKSGTGTWTLSGANPYTGTTTISNGTLSVSNVGNTGADSNLGRNGTVSFGATTTTGALLYTGTGETSDKALDLAGTTGGATINQSGAGLLKFTSNLTATGAGSKTLTLQGSTAGTGEIAGAIVDNSVANTTSLVKSGTGTWTLSGANTYTGTTIIDDGTLQVDGSIASTGAVTVTNGGTLAGSGAITGPVTVNASGKLAPGTSIDSLDIGALTFDSSATFAVELNTNDSPSVGADLVNVNGALNIAAGAILSLVDPISVYAGGTKFTLISYAGAWDNGIFLGHPDDSLVAVGANTYVINYNDNGIGIGENFGGGTYSNNVTLTAVPELSAFVFGGLVCCMVGMSYGVKIYRRNRMTRTLKTA